ncbi:MAG: SPASM domain-containing protein [Candidatus Aminicenantes bacterium]|nr:SPASM domain-containing protein [Candidatus Aminicenantes bacterium]
MKRDRLKPYVYKVKGAKNYALYDLFHGKIFQIIPEGEPHELREELLKENLIFETEGVVPYKLSMDLSKEFTELRIKELQLRLDGVYEDTCWSRNVVKKTGKRMDEKIVSILLEQVSGLEINRVRIETAEYDDSIKSIIERIVSSLQSRKIEIYSAHEFGKEEISSLTGLIANSNKQLEIKKREQVDLSEFDISMYRFFYSRDFNPCLGHKAAVDTNGDIKPCLWLNEIIGNIRENNIKDLITSGRFAPYWELSKNDIGECKACEMRYACNDCRVCSGQGDFSKEKRALFCKV